MNTRRLRMLDTAVQVVLDEVLKVQEWTQLEVQATRPVPVLPEEVVSRLSDLQLERASLVSGLDEALLIYAQARNEFAEEDALDVTQLDVNFSEHTYQEAAEAAEEAEREGATA